MKYMLAKMLRVSKLRKFPVDGIVHPAQKFLKATWELPQKDKEVWEQSTTLPKGDLYLGGSLPRVYTAGKNFLILP